MQKHVPSRYEALASENASHFIGLENAISIEVGGFEDERDRVIASGDFVEYMEAGLGLAGYSPDHKCSLVEWFQMGNSRDPFAQSIVNFLSIERSRALEEVYNDDDLFLNLLDLVSDAYSWLPMGALSYPGIGLRAKAPDVRALNDLIITVAKAIDKSPKIIVEIGSDEFEKTGASYGALVAAAKICRSYIKSFPIEQLTDPRQST